LEGRANTASLEVHSGYFAAVCREPTRETKGDFMRDTSRDGFINRAESYFLSHLSLFWRFIMAVPALRRWANKIIINRAARRTASRPYALSSMPTKGDATNEIAGYTPWESLTDQEWFGRHLPPRDLPIQPAIEDVVRLFKVGSGGPMLSSRSTLLFPSFAQWVIYRDEPGNLLRLAGNCPPGESQLSSSRMLGLIPISTD
jgi:hypothetical protein